MLLLLPPGTSKVIRQAPLLLSCLGMVLHPAGHVHALLLVAEATDLWRLLIIVRINGDRIARGKMMTFCARVRRRVHQSIAWLPL